MRALIQRCQYASVSAGGKLINQIDYGITIFIGISVDDNAEDINYLVNKIINLRIFDDEAGVMNKSIREISGKVLSISQFTLQADTSKGNRPSYSGAMKGEDAKSLYDDFNTKLSEKVDVYSGIFGANMQISLVNDGPVTIFLDSKNK